MKVRLRANLITMAGVLGVGQVLDLPDRSRPELNADRLIDNGLAEAVEDNQASATCMDSVQA